jgi:hypothetical protein
MIRLGEKFETSADYRGFCFFNKNLGLFSTNVDGVSEVFFYPNPKSFPKVVAFKNYFFFANFVSLWLKN